MAEYGFSPDSEPVLGIVFDGLGLGQDATIWGGEFLVANYQRFKRVGHFMAALPGVIAGSIFTFSLTLSDYIIPQIIGSSRLFVGHAVCAHQGTAGKIPLAEYRHVAAAGSMLAFALSFDEVIVTTFTTGQQQTLPIWMLEELVRPRQRPVTNVVAMVVGLVTFLPILAAFYLTRDGDQVAGQGK